jgi:hypothetical protein
MNDRDRLEQLRALLTRLERIPASAERDWMLAQVRSRAVDVDTGVKPAALRALPNDDAVAALAAAPATPKPKRKPAPRPAAPRRTWNAPVAPVSPPAPAAAPPPSAVDPLELGGVLCLDDQLAVPDGPIRAWSAGLRG